MPYTHVHVLAGQQGPEALRVLHGVRQASGHQHPSAVLDEQRVGPDGDEQVLARRHALGHGHLQVITGHPIGVNRVIWEVIDRRRVALSGMMECHATPRHASRGAGAVVLRPAVGGRNQFQLWDEPGYNYLMNLYPWEHDISRGMSHKRLPEATTPLRGPNSTTGRSRPQARWSDGIMSRMTSRGVKGKI